MTDSNRNILAILFASIVGAVVAPVASSAWGKRDNSATVSRSKSERGVSDGE